MKEQLEAFLTWATENGWTVQRRSDGQFQLPDPIHHRYSHIPEDYLEFLTHVDVCMMPDEKGWFLCIDDFNGTSDSAYNWNEFEQISLQAAKDSHDEEWKHSIIQFWDDHLPIFLSVRSGYAYYAINVADNLGRIVFNFEPEFEEDVDTLYPSFIDFLQDVMKGNIQE